MKTDKWFYELFLSQPGMLAELIPGIERDWEFVYTAPVVKEKEFRLDGYRVEGKDWGLSCLIGIYWTIM